MFTNNDATASEEQHMQNLYSINWSADEFGTK